MAQVYRALGSKVTIVEMLPRIVPGEDPETVAELAKALRKRGVAIHAPARVTGISGAPGSKAVTYTENGEEKTVESDLVLMATGRVPNTEGLGLEQLGVEFEGRAIKVNEQMETNVPGLYAIGDVNGGIQLAHVASAEGRVAAANACGRGVAMRYNAVPFCLFTSPELASVGLTEQAAREAGHEVKVGRFQFVALGKAVAIGERAGFVKVVMDAKSDVVLGAQIVGPNATGLIAEAALAVQTRLRADQLAETIHAHPTLAESVLEAIEDALGYPIHG
jgi:dihydrolipoamide dehydrogenase